MGPHVCRNCHKSFASSESLAQHATQPHTSVCPWCDFKTTNDKLLKPHLRAHRPDVGRCDKCDFVKTASISPQKPIKRNPEEEESKSRSGLMAFYAIYPRYAMHPRVWDRHVPEKRTSELLWEQPPPRTGLCDVGEEPHGSGLANLLGSHLVLD